MAEKETIIGLGILTVAVGALIFAVSGFWISEVETLEPAIVTTPQQNLNTKGNEEAQSAVPSTVRTNAGEVSVDIEPDKYDTGKFYLKLSVNTHTVNTLNEYDLRKIARLKYKGKEYVPIEATPLQGHHSTGTVVFEINEEPKDFSIEITDLYDKGVRTFKWP